MESKADLRCKMANILMTTVNAVVPIVLLILLGYVLKRIGFLTVDFIKVGNKLVFRVFLPCMLFVSVYDKMNSFSDIRWDVVLYSVIIICLIFALGVITAIATTKKKNRRGVILQCTFRSNFAIIGLTLVERLGGDAGLAGIVSAFTIPVFNVFSVIALSVFAEREDSVCSTEPFKEGVETQIKPLKSKKKYIKDIVLNVIKNPLIIGVFAGLMCVAVREIQRACFGEAVFRLDNQLKFLYTVVKDLKIIATPLALIVLGGQFEFSAVRGMTKEIVVGTVWRIILAPLIGIGLAVILSKFTDLFVFGADVYPALIALFATPVAVSSAIMAGEMKSDEQLATQLVVWTSIGSIFTIFIIVFVLMNAGLLMV